MIRHLAVDLTQPPARGFAQSGIRVANERAVLTLIALQPGSSNADLARQSGLGPQTTSRIVADLEARDLVKRGDVLRGRRGQPATPLFINPDGAYVIGVEIGWRSLEVVLISLAGQTLASISHSYCYPDADSLLDEVAAEVSALRAGLTAQQAARLVGIGVASPGTIDRGIVFLGAPPEQVERWHGLDIAARLSAMTGLDVDRINDGSAACWSEWLALPMPWPASFACFHVGTYVSAGIISNGSLWEGRDGDAANLGAIIVPDALGQPATVQQVASMLALQRRLEAVGIALPTGNPLNWDWTALRPVADAWLDDAGRALAIAVISSRAIVDFDQTLVDSVMPRALVARLVAHVNHHLALLPGGNRAPPVIMGGLGGSAAARGASQIALFRRFFSREWKLFAT